MKPRHFIATKPVVVFLVFLVFLVVGIQGCATAPQAPEEPSSEAKALRRLGEAYSQQGDYTSALRYYLEAEKMAPNDHVLQFNLGDTYIHKKLFDKAIVHLQKAIALKPDYSSARNSLGNAYILNKEYDKAIATLKALIDDESFSIYATPHYPKTNLGWAYYFKGQYPEAEESFLSALQFYEDGLPKDMTYLRILRGLGLTYLAEDRPEDAIQYLEKATAVKEYTGQVIYMDLARAYQEKGDTAAARSVYQKVIDINPATEYATEAREKLQFLRP